MMVSPPRWARSLLSFRLPASDRDHVVGDLDEQFLEVVDARGRWRARAWYWRHAVWLAWTLGGRQTIHAPGPSLTWRVLLDELRYAVRRLRKQPATSVASIVTLALAIGASVATWSVLSAVLIRPFPQVRTAGLVLVGTPAVVHDGEQRGAPANIPFVYHRHTYRTFQAIEQSGTFERVSSLGIQFTDVGVNGASVSRMVAFVSDNFFDVLGVRVRAGRGLLADDMRPGAAPVAVVSDAFWRRVMSGDPDAIGRELVARGHVVTVVGIAVEGFNGLSLSGPPDLYVPIPAVAALTGNNSNWLSDPARRGEPIQWLQVVAQLRPGTNAEQVAARLAALMPPQQFVASDLASAALSGDARMTMNDFARLLAITVALLLLIGCLTVGMLVLLRTEGRRDEFALCLALGASRTRLAGGVLTEAALLSSAGAVAGLPVALWLIEGVRAFGLPGRIRIEWLHLPFDWPMMGAAVGAAAVATLLMALVAGMFGVSVNVAEALGARAGVTPRIGRHRTRAVLCVVQMAVAMVLLAGAGLFARSLGAALSLNAGYDIGQIVSGTVVTASAKYTPEQGRAFFADLRERLSQHPGVRDVSISLFKGGGRSLVFHGSTAQLPRPFSHRAVDEHYFRTLGFPLSAGRNFTAHDRATGAPVAIVSVSLGRALAKGGDPLGRLVQFGAGPGVPPVSFEIVGIVPDIVVSVESTEPLVFYSPANAAEGIGGSATVTLHAIADPADVTRDVLATIRSMEPAIAQPVFATIEASLMKGMEPQQFGVTVLGALGSLAALLTLFGMYVLAEAMSAARRRELGVRAALGATRGQLSALVLSQTTRLVVLGIGAGLMLVWLGAGLIRALLYRVEPFDVPTIGTVVALLFAMAMAVTLRPALRAAQVDLARLLRE